MASAGRRAGPTRALTGLLITGLLLLALLPGPCGAVADVCKTAKAAVAASKKKAEGACTAFVQDLVEVVHSNSAAAAGTELSGARDAVTCPPLTSTEPGTAQCVVAVTCPPGFKPVACGCRVAQRGDDAFWVLYSQQWADADDAGTPACNCWWTNLGRPTSMQFQGLVDATCARTTGAAAASLDATPSSAAADASLPAAAPIPSPPRR
ncbi:hypothetical protein Rsub_12349 [Raphidocelis subcapitata]|uniref:Uncharacterized protein n=1 Tax=Raphidocelis subcapitata TaxID=307507 RepID=A0A2V0PN93_9CHLO|nr:hypothetical protein Rsub_12349 [Raphidocelis subcapitata]|eukprot:GBF99543.1 hypothetical protein Rsub_12349 [Raphidocelis subcapitata]